MRALLFATFVCASACSLVKGTHSSTIRGGSTPSSTSDATPASSDTTSSGGTKSYWTREDLQTLRGLTVEQATAKAKSQGFTGWIRTQVSSDFIEGCKQNTVCDVQDSHGMGGGTAADDGMMLYTNKPPIEISTPD